MADRVSFPAAPLSVRKARHYVSDQVVSLGLGELRSSVELLTSELVTNALVHAQTAFSVAVISSAEVIRIEVEDGLAPPLSRPLTPVAPEMAAGRGLHLVDAISSDWGVEATVEGKLVWFELSIVPEPDPIIVDR